MEVVDSNPNLRGIIVSQAPCPGFDAQTSKNAMDGLLAYLPRLQVLETRFTASYTVVTDTGYDAHKALYNCEGEFTTGKLLSSIFPGTCGACREP